MLLEFQAFFHFIYPILTKRGEGRAGGGVQNEKFGTNGMTFLYATSIISS